MTTRREVRDALAGALWGRDLSRDVHTIADDLVVVAELIAAEAYGQGRDDEAHDVPTERGPHGWWDR